MSSYFPNWLYGRYTPSMIDFSKYTHVVSLFIFIYAFLIPLINVHFSTMLSPSKTLLLLLLGLIPVYLMVRANAKLIWDGLFTHKHTDYVQYGFPKLVSLAHAAGTKVMVSVGGWSGSTQFSPMAASASNRAAWIKWNVDFVSKYGTDGVDIGKLCCSFKSLCE